MYTMNIDHPSPSPEPSPEFDPIDILYTKYRDEFTGITCDHYGDTVNIYPSNDRHGKSIDTIGFVFKDSKKETVRKVCESILRLIDQDGTKDDVIGGKGASGYEFKV